MDAPHLQVQEHALGLTGESLSCIDHVTKCKLYTTIVTRLSKPNLMTTPISMGEQWDHLG